MLQISEVIANQGIVPEWLGETLHRFDNLLEGNPSLGNQTLNFRTEALFLPKQHERRATIDAEPSGLVERSVKSFQVVSKEGGVNSG